MASFPTETPGVDRASLTLAAHPATAPPLTANVCVRAVSCRTRLAITPLVEWEAAYERCD